MLRCWEMRTRDNTIEGCIFPTIHSNRNTYPGQTCIVDAGSLINSAIWQIAEHEFEIDAVHLRCPEMNTGNWDEAAQCWCLVPGRLGRNCPFSCRSGVINI